MRYGSVCSGIEAATVAWHGLGWEPVWFSEIEPFPCRVLNHHYPNVPNLGSMLSLNDHNIYRSQTIDLLVGGTPCQSFSIAGLRAGLKSDNGNLALEFCRILIAKQPKWFVWENVPGVFSSFSDEEEGKDMEGEGRDNGRDITETADFATLLTAFRECGYSVCYRILDAQYFGVPQRRRRVFVVGYHGNDWRPSYAVLFEPDSLLGDFEEGGTKRKEVAGTFSARTSGGGCPGTDEALGSHVRVYAMEQITSPTNRINPKKGEPAPTIAKGTQAVMVMAHGQGGAEILEDLAPTLNCNHEQPIIINPLNCRPYADGLSQENKLLVHKAYTLHGSDGTVSTASETDLSMSLRTRPPGSIENSSTTIAQNGSIVRRLTPLECERLQGFPDNYTNIPKAKDSPRYSALGNSMAVPVMKWIGQRIQKVDKILK